MRTAYITHADCLLHEMGGWHPECPQRLQAINDRLIAAGLMDLLRVYDAPMVTREQLERVHPAAYVDEIAAAVPARGYTMLDPDTAMNPHSLKAAFRAAGAVVTATDLVVGGEVENAFCAVRPPGHHAEAARAMGFCIFNNIAVGVAHALAVHGLERVAILDFDVHHGNGTETIFRDDPRVMLCSAFQHPFYPNTPLDTEHANIVNAPVAANSYSEDFQREVTERWLPALDRFQPQMVFVSAGFDGHFEDDMAQLNLLDTDYAWLTALIVDVANRYADNRVVSTLEGGYALDALGRSVAVHIKGLMGV